MASPYLDSVTSPATLDQRFLIENGRPFAELAFDPGSRWGRQHLLACRVIVRSSHDPILPRISSYVDSVWNRETDLPGAIAALIDGPEISYKGLGERQLVGLYGVSLGQVWVALRVCRSPGEFTRSSTPPRRRQQTVREDYVDSGAMTVGSSPLRGDVSSGDSKPSSKDSSIGYIEGASSKLPDPPEDRTLRLVSCFIRQILYHFPPPSEEDLAPTIEFRDEKFCFKGQTRESQKAVRATDDGGRLVGTTINGTCRVDNLGVTLLEAKGRFQIVRDGKPFLSDDCLAQMTCEALALRLSRTRDNPK
ncbi:hypothetical protein VTK73DRAFT_9800 [Phialemonium thermophilum]|uniref:Uncharacterized protein n=1 Tax=Phialemonium thermophilum TaxID=223376 RepID=A0ABR3W043_9PEZI